MSHYNHIARKWQISLVSDEREIDNLVEDLDPEELGFIIHWWTKSLWSNPGGETLDAIWDFELTQERFPNMAKYRIQQMLKRLCSEEFFYRLRLRHYGRFSKTLYIPRVLPMVDGVYTARIHDEVPGAEADDPPDAQWQGTVGKGYMEEEARVEIWWISEAEKAAGIDELKRDWEVEVNGIAHAMEYPYR